MNEESHIVRQLRNKESGAMEFIYDNYADTFYGILLQILRDEGHAQDCLQDAMVKIWKNGNKYNADRGRLYTWMLTIVRRTAFDFMKSKNIKIRDKIQNISDVVYDKESDDKITPEHLDLRKYLGKLETKYAEVLDLVFFKGMTRDEASQHLDIPIGTVKTRLRIALREMRKWYVVVFAFLMTIL
ncbi:MAG: sigma-70 family RNA polymerase sigma factor [Eudoraea sp.]|nr:sigma-70 family RNA polymerase sigma factor [Eudoraea sp.]